MEWAIVVVVLLVALGFGGYLFLMLYYPEWVGITGASAHKTIAEHQEGSSVDDTDPFSSLPQDKK